MQVSYSLGTPPPRLSISLPSRPLLLLQPSFPVSTHPQTWFLPIPHLLQPRMNHWCAATLSEMPPMRKEDVKGQNYTRNRQPY
uniref:Uncharacterized protein n=1 Tax=Triticum urartu TaxID=4572 RepID=A0A8R7TVJ0_TRIUA